LHNEQNTTSESLNNILFKKNITNITLKDYDSYIWLFYKQLIKQYPGDVWVMFYPKKVMFYPQKVMFYPQKVMFYHKKVMFYPKKVMLMWNIPALSCCSDWRDKSFPLVGRSFPACGKNLSHWRELPLHLLLLSQHYNLTKTSPTISKHHQLFQNITKTSP